MERRWTVQEIVRGLAVTCLAVMLAALSVSVDGTAAAALPATSDCGTDGYRHRVLGMCRSCDEICLPQYRTLVECQQKCPHWRVAKPVPPVRITTPTTTTATTVTTTTTRPPKSTGASTMIQIESTVNRQQQPASPYAVKASNGLDESSSSAVVLAACLSLAAVALVVVVVLLLVARLSADRSCSDDDEARWCAGGLRRRADVRKPQEESNDNPTSQLFMPTRTAQMPHDDLPAAHGR